MELLFRRKNKEEVKIHNIELPPIDDLQSWVPQIIVALNLKEGDFTFLPAYGGVLLFIRSEGISWLPYGEIKEIWGKVEKKAIAESSAIAGSVVVAGSGAIIPIILARGIIKGSYRSFIKPPPNFSISILNSLIDYIEIIPQNKVSEKFIEKIEGSPFKDKDQTEGSYRLIIYKKFFSKHSKSTSGKIIKGLKSFVTRSTDLDFIIPGQSDLKKFSEILELNKIRVEWNEADITEGTD